MKNIIAAMLLLLLMLLFVSCRRWMPDKKTIGASIRIFVENSLGESLLDPAVEGNILDSDISVTYNDEVYQLNHVENENHGNGLYLDRIGDDDTPILTMGMFWVSYFYEDGGHTHDTFTINWGDGTSDEVKFEWYYGEEERYNVWLNGEPQSSSVMDVKIIR